MSILSDYMTKTQPTNRMRSLQGVLLQECKPKKDSSAEVCEQLARVSACIRAEFANGNPQVVSGDLLEKYRVKMVGAKAQRHTMDVYIFTGADDDPIYLAECKYRLTLPSKRKTLRNKESNLLEEVWKKYRISRRYLLLQKRDVKSVPAFLVCSELLAEPLLSDYVDYCDEVGVMPRFRIVDTEGLKRNLARLGLC